jgi:hypothetical protein
MFNTIFNSWRYAVELRHLRYMIVVAEEGHITRAAERLGIQHPPLSRLIKTIEQETNVQLFHRVPRGVELTDAGRAFIDGARAIFANLDRTLESARRTARGEEGRISVGFTTSAAPSSSWTCTTYSLPVSRRTLCKNEFFTQPGPIPALVLIDQSRGGANRPSHTTIAEIE